MLWLVSSLDLLRAARLSYVLAWQERYSRKTEATDLRRAFTLLDSKGDNRVDAEELAQLFHRLGHKERKVGESLLLRGAAGDPMAVHDIACTSRMGVVRGGGHHMGG